MKTQLDVDSRSKTTKAQPADRKGLLRDVSKLNQSTPAATLPTISPPEYVASTTPSLIIPPDVKPHPKPVNATGAKGPTQAAAVKDFFQSLLSQPSKLAASPNKSKKDAESK